MAHHCERSLNDSSETCEHSTAFGAVGATDRKGASDMRTNLRMGTTLLATLLACSLVACTSSDSSSGGTGGSVAPTGTGGSGGGGGSTATTPTGLGTLCPAPQQLINDFTYAGLDGGAAGDARFGGNGKLAGGSFISPADGANALHQDLSQNNWHISGTVATYSSFGLYLDNCDRIDASKFKGITFTLSGTAPNGVTLNVGTVGDTPTPTWMKANGKTTAKTTDSGRCVPTQDTQNQYYAPGCVSPNKNIPVTSAPTVVSVTWADLTGGAPDASPNPAELTSLSWSFQWAESGVAPYAVDVVIDNLGFIP
jgi:hypothetical protein